MEKYLKETSNSLAVADSMQETVSGKCGSAVEIKENNGIVKKQEPH